MLRSFRPRSIRLLPSLLVAAFAPLGAALQVLDSDVAIGWKLLDQGAPAPSHNTGDAADARGELVVVLGKDTAGDEENIRLRAIDATTGSERWATAIDGVDSAYLDAVSVEIAPAGDRVVAVSTIRESWPGSGPNPVAEVVVTQHDAATGAELWRFAWSPPGGESAVAFDATLLPDGSGVAIAGQVASLDALVLVVNADGSLRWSLVWDGPDGYGDKALDVVANSASSLFVAIDSIGATTATDVELLALDQASGAEQWSLRLTSTAHVYDRPIDLEVDAADNWLYVGIASLDLDAVFGIAAGFGTVLWSEPYPGNSLEDLALSPDGARLAVTGRTNTSNRDFRTRVHDAHVGSVAWSMDYDSPGPGDYDWPHHLAFLPDGATLLVAGDSEGDGPGSLFGDPDDLAVVAYDAGTGAELWTHRHDPAAGSVDSVGLLMATVAGAPRPVAVGSIGNVPGDEVHVVALDPSGGGEVWSDVDVGVLNAGLAQTFDAFAMSADGSTAFVATASPTGPFGFGGVLEVSALDAATGAELWSSSVGSGFPLELEPSPDGTRLYVLGGSHAFLLWSLDSADGSVLWSATSAGTGDYGTGPSDLVVSPDGSRIYCAGESQTLIDPIYLISVGEMTALAFDAATGTELWSADWSGAPHLDAWANAVAVSADGSTVVMAGGSRSLATSTDMTAVGLDAATGAELWVRTVDGGTGGYDEARVALGDPAADRVYLTGAIDVDAFDPARFGCYALAPSDGTLLWSDPGDLATAAATNSYGIALELAADGGRLYAVGQEGAPGGFGTSVHARALDPATGALLWNRAADSEGNGFASGLAVLPDGRSLAICGRGIGGVPQVAHWDVWGLDAATGAELWHAREGPMDGGFWQLLAGPVGIGAGERAAVVAGRASSATEALDALALRYELSDVLGGPPELSLATGGPHELLLDAGPAHAGEIHLVLGSMSGTSPGTPVGGLVLPLSFDAYSLMTLTSPNSAIHVGTLGVLDGDGRAEARVVLPTGLSPSLAGTVMHHAFVSITASALPSYASQASRVVLAP